MNERVLIFIIMCVLSAILWIGIDGFLLSTNDASRRLSTRTVNAEIFAQQSAASAKPAASGTVVLSRGIQSVPAVRVTGANSIANTSADVAIRPATNTNTNTATGTRSATALTVDSVASSPKAAKSTKTTAAVGRIANERPDSDQNIVQQISPTVAPGNEPALMQATSIALIDDILGESQATNLQNEVTILQNLDTALLDEPAATRAIDVVLRQPDNSCNVANIGRMRTGVLFRYQSFAIKGRSLNGLDEIVGTYNACGGKLMLSHNPQGLVDASRSVNQRRHDEVKYYLLQRGIPKAAIVAVEKP